MRTVKLKNCFATYEEAVAYFNKILTQPPPPGEEATMVLEWNIENKFDVKQFLALFAELKQNKNVRILRIKIGEKVPRSHDQLDLHWGQYGASAIEIVEWQAPDFLANHETNTFLRLLHSLPKIRSLSWHCDSPGFDFACIANNLSVVSYEVHNKHLSKESSDKLQEIALCHLNYQKAKSCIELMGEVAEIPQSIGSEIVPQKSPQAVNYQSYADDAERYIQTAINLAEKIGGVQGKWLQFSCYMLTDCLETYNAALDIYRASLKERERWDVHSSHILKHLKFKDLVDIFKEYKGRFDSESYLKSTRDKLCLEKLYEEQSTMTKEDYLASLLAFYFVLPDYDRGSNIVANPLILLLELMGIGMGQQFKDLVAIVKAFPKEYSVAMSKVLTKCDSFGLLNKLEFTCFSEELLVRLFTNDPLLRKIQINRHPEFESNFSAEDMRALLRALKNNTCVQELILDASVIDPVNDEEEDLPVLFCEYLSQNTTLKKLYWGTDAGNNKMTEQFFQILGDNSTLVEVTLERFRFGNLTNAKAALQKNTSLKHLTLQSCTFIDVAVRNLTESLVNNRAIETIDLKDTGVTAYQRKLFCAFLQDNLVITKFVFGDTWNGERSDQNSNYQDIADLIEGNQKLQTLELPAVHNLRERDLLIIGDALTKNQYLKGFTLRLGEKPLPECVLEAFFIKLLKNSHITHFNFMAAFPVGHPPSIVGNAFKALINFVTNHPKLEQFKYCDYDFTAADLVTLKQAIVQRAENKAGHVKPAAAMK